jgi:hypothetical protein
VGQGELETLDEELLDVGAADIVGLLELNNLEDLEKCQKREPGTCGRGKHTWTDLKRER